MTTTQTGTRPRVRTGLPVTLEQVTALAAKMTALTPDPLPPVPPPEKQSRHRKNVQSKNRPSKNRPGISERSWAVIGGG